MRKHRKWWMGLGIGIMLGAMMLQLINFAQAQSQSLSVDKAYTQEQLDEAVAKAKKDAELAFASKAQEEQSGAEDAEDAAASNPPGQGAAGNQTDGAGGTQPGANPAASAEPSTEQIVAFYVNPGMALIKVARSLHVLGVIDDVDDFVDAARPISKRIEVGTAMFTGRPTYEEIIAELTRPKND